MNFVKKFKSFISNTKHIISSNLDTIDHRTIFRLFHQQVDTEIVDNCNDILRDFNEDNDSYLEIKLYPIVILNSKSISSVIKGPSKEIIFKDGLDDLLDKSDIIDVFISDPLTSHIFIKSCKLEIQLFKHLRSYLNSIGYNKYIHLSDSQKSSSFLFL